MPYNEAGIWVGSINPPVNGFRDMMPIHDWKIWTTPDTMYNSRQHTFASIPANPGILGILFFHQDDYRTQWYGEDAYTMWGSTVLNGRAVSETAYARFRDIIFADQAPP